MEIDYMRDLNKEIPGILNRRGLDNERYRYLKKAVELDIATVLEVVELASYVRAIREHEYNSIRKAD